MTIQSEITKKDYSMFMTTHLLKTPYMIMIVVLGLAFLIYYAQNPELGQFYLFLGLGFVGLPVLTFFTIGQSYERNKHFNEKIEFIVEDGGLELVGQTFRSSFTWDQITRVKESSRFFSIYQGRILLSLINKETSSRDVIDSLRAFFKDKKKM